ncbi:MAG TPA: hypothetical protein VFA28_09165 [Bryobacteraceae bacterium]|jgi:hypothetical protein|nr:hypothetical protein [Bryobacteraceae bacterium]
MTRRALILVVPALAVGLAGQAFAKPNFTGDWKLNADKSNFGPIPPPTAMTLNIEHSDPNLKILTKQSGAQGDMEYEAKYTTDGKESVNKFGEAEAKSVVNWDGDALVNDTKLSINGNEITIKSKWTLSEDGKVLTNNAHLVSPQGELDMTQVFEKQEKKTD